MRTLDLSVAGVVASVFLFGSVGSVSAQDIWRAEQADLQFEREVRSTYLIQFRSSVAPSEIKGRANAIAARFGGQIKYTYERVFPGFAIRMNAAAMARLLDADDLGILKISRDEIVSIFAKGDKGPPPGKGGNSDSGGSSCPETLGWNIERVTPIIQDSDGTDSSQPTCNVTEGNTTVQPNYSGSSIKVCVIDTGIAEHIDLNNKSFDTPYNFTNDKSADDLHGHGTHVAGIIGAFANNDNGVVGVAPGVGVYPIKVLNRRGSGSLSGVMMGVQAAAEEDCTIANLSLGAATLSTVIDDAVLCASGINAYGTEPGAFVCTDNSVVFTLAAGNSTKEIDGYSPARVGDGNNKIFTIASFGLGDALRPDDWSYFSNFSGNEKVDFALPGGGILSTVKDGEYKTYSGTSMAAPHMAGLLVRYLEGGGTYLSVDNDILKFGGDVQRDDVFENLIYDWYDIIVDK